MPEQQETSYDSARLLRRMDDSRFTGRHLGIYLIALTGHFLDGFVINMTGVILPGVVHQFRLSSGQAGAFSSLLFAGMLVGAAAAGTMSDRLGRKFPLTAAILVFGVFSLVAAFTPSYGWLLAARTLQGVGLGAEIAIVLPYIAEFVPSRHRGPLVTGASAVWICGLPVSAAIGALLVPSLGWRSMFAVGGLSVLAALLVVAALPESVRFSLRRGRFARARRVVDGLTTPAPEGRPVPVPEAAEPAATEGAGTVRSLLRRPYLRYTLSIWLMELCAGAHLYGLSSWLPSILERQGVGLLRSFGYTAIITAASVVGAILAGQLINRVGRRWVLTVSLMVSGLLCLAWGASTATAAVLVLGALVQLTGSGIGGATLFAYASELYPTASRATGLGWAAAWQKAGGLVMPAAVGFVLAMQTSTYVFFVMFCVISFVAGLSALIATFETRGRTVEQITRELSSGRAARGRSVPNVEAGA